MGMPSNLVGKRFGLLTVLELSEPLRGLRSWRCRCKCGKHSVVPTGALNSGNTKSCGCLQRSVLGNSVRTHGMSNSRITGYVNRTYGIWQAMRDRCSNPNRKDYHRYGGRGITVCKRWAKFENFLSDMGECPLGLTLDRKDNNKGYSPNNCQWATRREQGRNTIRNKLININGATQCLLEWLVEYQVPKNRYYARLRYGWSVVDAITKPLYTRQK